MTSGIVSQEGNKRSDYRVAVPPGFIRGLAVWLRPEADYVRLPLAELGRPDLSLSTLTAGTMSLSDLSIRGMGLTLSLPSAETERLAGQRSCFAYLRLLDPSQHDPYGVLSVFTLCRVAHMERMEGSLFMGVRFLRFAVGCRLEKSLEFLDARSCGVTSLARWCDNLDRGVHLHAGSRSPGLDLDHLLEELEALLAAEPPCTGDTT